MSNMQEDSSGPHIWLVLMKAYRSLLCHAERCCEVTDVGVTDFVVLEMLLHKGPQKVNDIGRAPMLANGPHTGKYRVGHLDEKSGSKIARADVADFMLKSAAFPLLVLR